MIQIVILAVLVAIPLLYLGKKYFNGGVNKYKPSLVGKTVLITGGNTGIGKETALELAKLGAKVVIASRNPGKSKDAVEDIKKASGNKEVECMELDLSDLESIKRLAENFIKKNSRLDILINNAALMALPTRQETKYGIEMQMGTNHFGHFYLTHLLFPLLKKSTPSRIINVSSTAHFQTSKWSWENINQEKPYDPWVAYGNSKLANIYFTQELQRRVGEGSGIKTVSLHPGVVRTELLLPYFSKHKFVEFLQTLIWPGWWYISKDSNQGAQTTLYCALCDFDKLDGGKYHKDCKVNYLGRLARSEENAKKLWEYTINKLKNHVDLPTI